MRSSLSTLLAFAVFALLAGEAEAQQNNDLSVNVQSYVVIESVQAASITIDPSTGDLQATKEVSPAYSLSAVSATTHDVTAEVTNSSANVVSLSANQTSGGAGQKTLLSGGTSQGAKTINSGVSDAFEASFPVQYTVGVDKSFDTSTSQTVTVQYTIN